MAPVRAEGNASANASAIGRSRPDRSGSATTSVDWRSDTDGGSNWTVPSQFGGTVRKRRSTTRPRTRHRKDPPEVGSSARHPRWQRPTCRPLSGRTTTTRSRSRHVRVYRALHSRTESRQHSAESEPDQDGRSVGRKDARAGVQVDIRNSATNVSAGSSGGSRTSPVTRVGRVPVWRLVSVSLQQRMAHTTPQSALDRSSSKPPPQAAEALHTPLTRPTNCLWPRSRYAHPASWKRLRNPNPPQR